MAETGELLTKDSSVPPGEKYENKACVSHETLCTWFSPWLEYLLKTPVTAMSTMSCPERETQASWIVHKETDSILSHQNLVSAACVSRVKDASKL